MYDASTGDAVVDIYCVRFHGLAFQCDAAIKTDASSASCIHPLRMMGTSSQAVPFLAPADAYWTVQPSQFNDSARGRGYRQRQHRRNPGRRGAAKGNKPHGDRRPQEQLPQAEAPACHESPPFSAGRPGVIVAARRGVFSNCRLRLCRRDCHHIRISVIGPAAGQK